MAQQAAVKKAAGTTGNGAVRGRPAGARNLTAVERAAKKDKVFDYSRWKLSFQKPADFFLYLEGYPDKAGLLGSVYRLRPRIDHSLIGNPQSAILQTSMLSEMTEEFIGENYGRGTYMLKLTDANRPKGQTECCRTWFDIADVEKPPQYDPRTLCLGEPKNQDEITRLLNAGVFIRDATGAPRLRTETDGGPVLPSSASNGHGGHSGGELFGRDVVGQIVLAALNRTAQSPHDAVKDTIEVARLLAPEQKPVDLEMLVERVFTRMRGVPAGDVPLDAFAQFERVEKFISRFRTPGAPAAAGGGPVDAMEGLQRVGDSWAPHLGKILSEARALITEGVGAFRLLQSEKQTETVVPQKGAQPMTMEQRIEQIFRLGFAKMQEGMKGFDFAAFVCFHMPGGLEVYRRLEPSGALGLIALAGMNPQAGPIINDPKIRPQLEAFLTDFFSFDPAGSAEELPAGAGAPSA